MRKFVALYFSSTLSHSQRSSNKYLSTIYLPDTLTYPSLRGFFAVISYHFPSLSLNAYLSSVSFQIVEILLPGTYTRFCFTSFAYFVAYFRSAFFILESIACLRRTACRLSVTIVCGTTVGRYFSTSPPSLRTASFLLL